MDKISIAMATYNGEKYVEKQLLSLLNQTRMADEVIIRDDCSTDNTAKVVTNFIKRHSLENWHFTVNEHNLGYKRNFYETIRQTTGDIIFLCDQDDIWLTQKIADIERLFRQNPGVLAASTTFDFIDEEDKPFRVVQSSNKSNHNLIKIKILKDEAKKIDFATICTYNISPGCTAAFKKSIKDIYLDNTKCKVVHDWEINFVAACLGGLYFYNRPLIQYRIHSNNTIGLDGIVDGSNIKKMGNYYYRLSIAKLMYEYMESFIDYRHLLSADDEMVLSVQRQFVTERFHAIYEKSVFKILKLYRYNGNYKKSVTFKGRLADIACTVLPAKNGG